MQSSPGTLISFTTQPRSAALDDDDGHSPYTRALVETMQRPGFGLFKTFNEVALAVERATHGDQLLWLSSSPISRSFYFAGKPVAATQANLPTPAAAIGQTPLAPRDDALRFRSCAGASRPRSRQDRHRGGRACLRRRHESAIPT
jgi:hypothetical protein